MAIDSDDSDAADMKRIMYENQKLEGSDNESMEDENEDDEEGEMDQDGSDDQDDEEAEEDFSDSDQEMQESGDASSSDDSDTKKKAKKRTLKDRLKEEQEIRVKEKNMRSKDYQPKDIDDYERLLIANQDQSYLWIQYVAFMLDNLGIDAARKVAERAVKSVSMSNE